MVKTEVMLGRLTLRNPVLVASGTFGYGDECTELVDTTKLGGIVTKSLSLNPRTGNRPPRIVETPSGMLNSIGLANIGVRGFIERKLPILRRLGTTVIANIAASTIEEYSSVLSLLEEEDGIGGYEINVSCPNVKEGGLSFGTNLKTTALITAQLRPLTDKPLILKLTPNVTRIGEFAQAVADAGADAVSVMNTVVGMAVDIRTRRSRLSTVTGGLSGPAVKPISLAKVYEVHSTVKIPIIGIGGIMTVEDAVEFFLVGASAVQVGTANFIDPAVGAKIAEGLTEYCRDHGIGSVSELVGALQV